MMRSQGQLNLDNSEAAKNYGEATSQAIDNRKKWTETYFEMRKSTGMPEPKRPLPEFPMKMQSGWQKRWPHLGLDQHSSTR